VTAAQHAADVAKTQGIAHLLHAMEQVGLLAEAEKGLETAAMIAETGTETMLAADAETLGRGQHHQHAMGVITEVAEVIVAEVAMLPQIAIGVTAEKPQETGLLLATEEMPTERGPEHLSLP
jgi:serine acetyltransferase